ncbi:hypothetical protein ECO319P1_00099 [Escherichia phage ECO319P1]|nr:hypothetical protein ECO319P1_00099 [Escherichia phage ECO319P1]
MYAFLIKALILFGENLLIAIFGEPTIKWVFFKIAKWLANKTPTTIDDEFIEKIEENYPKK